MSDVLVLNFLMSLSSSFHYAVKPSTVTPSASLSPKHILFLHTPQAAVEFAPSPAFYSGEKQPFTLRFSPPPPLTQRFASAARWTSGSVIRGSILRVADPFKLVWVLLVPVCLLCRTRPSNSVVCAPCRSFCKLARPVFLRPLAGAYLPSAQ